MTYSTEEESEKEGREREMTNNDKDARGVLARLKDVQRGQRGKWGKRGQVPEGDTRKRGNKEAKKKNRNGQWQQRNKSTNPHKKREKEVHTHTFCVSLSLSLCVCVCVGERVCVRVSVRRSGRRQNENLSAVKANN